MKVGSCVRVSEIQDAFIIKGSRVRAIGACCPVWLCVNIEGSYME